jgi:hypothetical protein
MILACPQCNDVIEILGEPPRPLPECEACGAVLEVCDENVAFDITPAGALFLEEMRDHPATARRLTADFDRLFPVEPGQGA